MCKLYLFTILNEKPFLLSNHDFKQGCESGWKKKDPKTEIQDQDPT